MSSNIGNAPAEAPDAHPHQLDPGRLTTAHIVFFVIAAAAPLAVYVGTGPFLLRFGGIGAPGVMLAVGVIIFLFACGFTAMSKYVRDAGAFYAYVGRGLGRSWGTGTAVMTMVAYGLCSIGFTGYIGFYAADSASSMLGIDLPWQVWTVLFAALVAVLGFLQVEVGARLLGVILLLEVGVIVISCVAVLIQGGPEPASAAPFDPDNVFFADGTGILFLLCFGAFVGFESTAIYAEEAKNPERSVPRATFIAVGFLGVFYAASFWVLSYGFGVNGAAEAAQQDDFLAMAFVQAAQYVGTPLSDGLQVLIITSYLACIIAFHNACARYMFSMGRAGILPRSLSRTHPRSGAPYVASGTLSVIMFATLAVAFLLDLEPFLELGTWLYAAGIIGLVAAQALCAIAVVVFFLRDRRGHGLLRVLIAPLVGGIGLIVGLWLMVDNFSIISGYTDTAVNMVMIGVTPFFFLVGLLLHRVRSRHDDVELALGEGE